MGELPNPNDTMRLEEPNKYLSPEIKGSRVLRQFAKNSQSQKLIGTPQTHSASRNGASLNMIPSTLSKSKSSKMNQTLQQTQEMIASHPRLKLLKQKPKDDIAKPPVLSVPDSIYASPYFSTQEEVLKLVAIAEAENANIIQKKAQLPPLHKSKMK